MREKSEITHHRRQVPSGLGRRAGVSPGPDAGEFPLAYVVAFQHAICHPIPGGDGIHQHANFNAPTVPPRKSLHSVYHRRAAIARAAWRWRKMSEAILRTSCHVGGSRDIP
jgi:hypothetical protein